MGCVGAILACGQTSSVEMSDATIYLLFHRLLGDDRRSFIIQKHFVSENPPRFCFSARFTPLPPPTHTTWSASRKRHLMSILGRTRCWSSTTCSRGMCTRVPRQFSLRILVRIERVATATTTRLLRRRSSTATWTRLCGTSSSLDTNRCVFFYPTLLRTSQRI